MPIRSRSSAPTPRVESDVTAVRPPSHGPIAWFRHPAFLPLALALLALALLLPNLVVLSPEDLYPVESDSAKYDAAARGVAAFVDELPQALPRLVTGSLTPEDRERYDWESGILQHAASYVGPLGITYAWFGSDPRVGRVFTALLTAAAAALLVLWSERRFGRVVALASGLAFVFWPTHVRFGTAIMTEMAMVFWMLVAVVALEQTRTRGLRLAALGGAVVALAVLAKISLRYVLPILLIVDLLELGAVRGKLRFAGARLAGVAGVLVLWGGFLAVADLPASGVVAGFDTELFLFRGNYPPNRGFEDVGLGDVNDPVVLESVRAHPESAYATTDERMRAIYADALRRVIREDPGEWMALVLAKAGWFWRYPGLSQDVETWFGRLPPPARLQPLVVLLACVGLGSLILARRPGFLPLTVALYLTALHAGSHLVARYNVPAVALGLPLAAHGLVVVLTPVLRGVRRLLRREGRWSGEESGSATAIRELGARLHAAVAATPRSERIALLAVPGFALLFLLFPRDVGVGLGLSFAVARVLSLALGFAVFLAGAMGLCLRAHRNGAPIWRALAVGGLPLVLGLGLLGDALADRDADAFRVRLDHPGDRIVQTLALPADLDWDAVSEVQVFIDMLAEGRPEAVVRVDGRELRRFPDGLVNPEEDYLLDARVHAVQERYRRIEAAYTRQIEDHVRHRHPQADPSWFRQWFRIPVEVEALRGRAEVVIEIELIDPRGGALLVWGDATEPTAGADGKSRRVEAPAFLENPYELSTYQFSFFGTNRERADVRLTRPLQLFSVDAAGVFFRQGAALPDLGPERGVQRGEYRIRLRTALHGLYVRRKRDDRWSLVWAVRPGPEDRPVSADELRVFSARRDEFFGGWRSY